MGAGMLVMVVVCNFAWEVLVCAQPCDVVVDILLADVCKIWWFRVF